MEKHHVTRMTSQKLFRGNTDTKLKSFRSLMDCLTGADVAVQLELLQVFSFFPYFRRFSGKEDSEGKSKKPPPCAIVLFSSWRSVQNGRTLEECIGRCADTEAIEILLPRHPIIAIRINIFFYCDDSAIIRIKE